ncbi:MAG: hypothetical protein M1829_003902 [Trizodia sp. TS-e1964]|nr:MAG: hypothetical protein M1829_003902 [Trizodia sp. TS-e1964]
MKPFITHLVALAVGILASSATASPVLAGDVVRRSAPADEFGKSVIQALTDDIALASKKAADIGWLDKIASPTVGQQPPVEDTPLGSKKGASLGLPEKATSQDIPAPEPERPSLVYRFQPAESALLSTGFIDGELLLLELPSSNESPVENIQAFRYKHARGNQDASQTVGELIAQLKQVGQLEKTFELAGLVKDRATFQRVFNWKLQHTGLRIDWRDNVIDGLKDIPDFAPAESG